MLSVIEHPMRKPVSKIHTYNIESQSVRTEACTQYSKFNFKKVDTDALTAEEFVQFALRLEPHQAVCTGYYENDGLHPRKASLMRVYNPVIRLDIDYAFTPEPLTLDDLSKIHPLLGDCWAVQLPSQSNILLNGEAVNPHKMSFYIKTVNVASPQQLKQLARFFEIRAGNAFGIKIRISGGFPRQLVTTVIDSSVLKDITRIAFIQRPVMITPPDSSITLEWNTGIIAYRQGPPLDASRCVLTFPEETKYREVLNAAKQRAEDDFKAARARFREEQPEQFQLFKAVEGSGFFKGKLYSINPADAPLDLEATLTSIFEASFDLSSGDGETEYIPLEQFSTYDLKDPYEPDYAGGAAKAKVFIDEEGARISSFAHGHYTVRWIVSVSHLIYLRTTPLSADKPIKYLTYNKLQSFLQEYGKYISYTKNDLKYLKGVAGKVSGDIHASTLVSLIETHCSRLSESYINRDLVDDILTRYRMLQYGNNELYSLVEEQYGDMPRLPGTPPPPTYPAITVTKNLKALQLGEQIPAAEMEEISDKIPRIAKMGCYPLHCTPENTLNLYMGTIQPLRESVTERDIRPFLFHLALIDDNIRFTSPPDFARILRTPAKEFANIHSPGYTWLLNYLSCFIHNQAVAEFKPALEILGTHGAGKSLLGDMLEEWLHPLNCYSTASWDDIFGKFNIILAMKTFIRAEEAARVEGGNNAYKNYITNDAIAVEAKFGTKMMVPACAWVMSTSNSLEGSYIEATDRRTMVFRISSLMASTAAKTHWWEPYMAWWRAGGREKVFTYFYSRQGDMKKLIDRTGTNKATLQTKLGFLEGKPTGFMIHLMLQLWWETDPVPLGSSTALYSQYVEYVQERGRGREATYTTTNKFTVAVKHDLNRAAKFPEEEGYYLKNHKYWLDVPNAKKALSSAWNLTLDELEELYTTLEEIFTPEHVTPPTLPRDSGNPDIRLSHKEK